jgi:hypothetical protein
MKDSSNTASDTIIQMRLSPGQLSNEWRDVVGKRTPVHRDLWVEIGVGDESLVFGTSEMRSIE